jgi:hypothetical protein
MTDHSCESCQKPFPEVTHHLKRFCDGCKAARMKASVKKYENKYDAALRKPWEDPEAVHVPRKRCPRCGWRQFEEGLCRICRGVDKWRALRK